MKKEVEFNETELIGSMHEAVAHARGRLTLRTTKVPRRNAMLAATLRLTNLPEALVRKCAAGAGL